MTLTQELPGKCQPQDPQTLKLGRSLGVEVGLGDSDHQGAPSHRPLDPSFPVGSLVHWARDSCPGEVGPEKRAPP